jgi:hypothetical protein
VQSSLNNLDKLATWLLDCSVIRLTSDNLVFFIQWRFLVPWPGHTFSRIEGSRSSSLI